MPKSIVSLLACCMLLPASLTAETIAWVDWTVAQNGKPGFAAGEVKVGTKIIKVQYSGDVLFGQTNEGTDYWQPSEPYLSALVGNAPPNAELITLTGGTSIQNTLTFSTPINNPVIAWVGLGKSNSVIEYNFDQAFNLISSGTGFFGGDTSSLFKTFENTLAGKSGHGVIQIPGSVTSISWNSAKFNSWQGFTVGIPESGGSCEDKISTLSPNLDISIPSLKFQGVNGEIDYWGELEYMGTDLNGNVLWRLKNYGENQ